ncbi:sensor histidine kinase [Sediminibacillus halophilus]|uniref:histidine kinase n=1 Tax=Sediminibacillus halophilus TaxID=482461 RepID=A0A1G9RFR5_9BACI|nr:sensor histidine kinase [Sediminibacillus halophilus]SDM22152.1 Histidine kinase-, DNA gyrase B-, and HSP90-like ATPase [Sediminibacillus halophilus]
MKSIRTKLIFYFFVFVILFNIVSISIYVSSNTLTNSYHSSFERFLLLNSISQSANKLYENTKAYVMEQSEENQAAYYQSRRTMKQEEKRLQDMLSSEEQIQTKNYINLIDNIIYESEITTGFVLRDDIERYTAHLKETESSASYIQETTLHLIDLELTEYQTLYQDLQERNEAFRWFTFFVFTTTVMLAVFFAIWFSNGINKPIQTLTKAAREVSHGDFDGEPVDVRSNDELKLLGSSFNQMRANIRELIKEIKDQSEQERLMKELELKHLQNQVNPHFLFNTLNTISKMAYLEEAKSTSNLIDSTAALLRYSLGDIEKFVPLREEVRAVREYLTIQKTRFTERITFVVEVDETCLDFPIPRLTLQPLVENAFIHGVEEQEEGGEIKLFVYEEKTAVVVVISDNGKGMTEDKVASILNVTKDKAEDHIGHSTGLGVSNVIRRLQLFYRTEEVIEIESQPEEGTQIKLLLTKQFTLPGTGDQEGGNDESTNSGR